MQRPHPPILIGGSGERKTLRLVARYADACNLFDLPGTDLRRKLAVLQGHCAETGRDYKQIEKTVTTMFDPGQGAPIDHLRELAALGLDHVLLAPPRGWDDQTLDALASIVPEVHAIEPR